MSVDPFEHVNRGIAHVDAALDALGPIGARSKSKAAQAARELNAARSALKSALYHAGRSPDAPTRHAFDVRVTIDSGESADRVEELLRGTGFVEGHRQLVESLDGGVWRTYRWEWVVDGTTFDLGNEPTAISLHVADMLHELRALSGMDVSIEAAKAA